MTDSGLRRRGRSTEAGSGAHGTAVDEDYRRLHEFLLSGDAPEHCMMIDELHGFLTAVISGPCVIMPSEWMPLIWNGEELEFESEEQMTAVIEALMNVYNDVACSLRDGDYSVMHAAEHDAGGRVTCDAVRWCVGYLQGVGLRDDLWSEWIDDDLGDLMTPIMILAAGRSLPESARILDEPGAVEALTERLPAVALAVYYFWREHEPDALASRPDSRRGKKVGRNDPCPCGSGKKYKRCCGAADKVH